MIYTENKSKLYFEPNWSITAVNKAQTYQLSVTITLGRYRLEYQLGSGYID